MSSLIPKQVKTNVCLISVKFFIVLTTFVPLFTFNWYNTNYNTNMVGGGLRRDDKEDTVLGVSSIMVLSKQYQ